MQSAQDIKSTCTEMLIRINLNVAFKEEQPFKHFHFMNNLRAH